MNRQLCFEFGETLYRSTDATVTAELIFVKPCTLREFIKDVLTKKDEFGYIGVEPICYKEGKATIFGDPYVEYRYGKLLYDFPEEFLDRKIDIESDQHKASGGYSRMDYLVVLEE